MTYDHLTIERDGHVATLWLDRPDSRNALSEDMWEQIPQAMSDLGDDNDVGVVIVAGRGPAFTAGIDLEYLAGLMPGGESPAAQNMAMYQKIKELQRTISSMAECPKPVIAAIHGYCIGAGVHLISACDLRLAASNSVISLREARLAIVPDIGALQRLPYIIGAGNLAELALTGKDIDAKTALSMGLVNKIYDGRAELIEGANELAQEIAANSTLAVQGIKSILRSLSQPAIDRSLDQVALWNSSFISSNDLGEAMAARLERRNPDFKGN